ncbi:Mitogen-activated protein kinase kinase [Ceratobasidium theobromae]|uniref:mitogen-activated protein kinase kinase n=1 Tax=Ceratobasidium theobromae TaxID=1582974 RepID=A0A5N5QHA6_9AGAM|nr:Mitogen-activated protein kinase kinase [Ceratobasidium theobromae]
MMTNQRAPDDDTMSAPRPMGPRRALPLPPREVNEMVAALGPPPSTQVAHGLVQATPMPSPMPSPGLLPVAPLNVRTRPRVEVPRHPAAADTDSADADDERSVRRKYTAQLAVLDERSPLPEVPSRPKLALRTASGSALPDSDAPAPRPKLGLALPRPSLRLDVVAAPDSDDEADYSYYGFKPSSRRPPQLTIGQFPSDATTMQPSTTTARPQHQPGNDLDDVRRAINELRMPELDERDDEQWSDDVLDVLDRLGEGAGGAVCKVRDTRSGRLMARKTIPTGTVPARQLLRELQFSKLVHPNLIVCYGAYISAPDKERPEGFTPEIHILMELGEGGALDAIARQMKSHHANLRIGEKVIARLAEGVLKGLDYMHTNKVTHRDIKPSNILVTRSGVVKLCDFGVSGELEMSLASTFTGTSWYMAPERITGHPYSIRADVWSTGLTFLELAQNRFPYPPDLGPIELLTYIVNGEVRPSPSPSLADLSPQVPELDDEPGDEHGNGAIHWSDGIKSLRIDAATRPIPREMLQHPWIQESIARKLDMAKWIREVWGWEKPPKAKRSSGL